MPTRPPSRPRRASCGATARPARQIDVDICVVGAGSRALGGAGGGALGRKVALVDGLHALGGQAVNSVIGTFCGLFANGTAATRPSTASRTVFCTISARRARCTIATAGRRTPWW